jgi:hypothetical protein
MVVLDVVVSVLLLAAVGNDVRRFRGGKNLWTANSYAHAMMRPLGPRASLAYLAALGALGVGGLLFALGRL